jgi:hypothetical protein
MPAEPSIKRAVAFVDGQNLFHAAREAFGYTFPNYDVVALSQAVCRACGYSFAQARFYTGIPVSRSARRPGTAEASTRRTGSPSIAPPTTRASIAATTGRRRREVSPRDAPATVDH